MEILLTNDDSHDSPLFHFLIEKLKAFGRVTAVVPKTEQSWTGKSMTRFEALTASEEMKKINGRKISGSGLAEGPDALLRVPSVQGLDAGCGTDRHRGRAG